MSYNTEKIIVKNEDTGKEEAKVYRREHGDRGGCKYPDKLHRPSPWPWSNTVSTVTKDNLLCVTFR